MASNPFTFLEPVSSDHFFGRGAVVNKIAEDLYSSSNSFSIIGGKRFGKSSLLFALKNRLIDRLEHDSNSEWLILPVFISLKARAHTSAQDVLGLMLYKIKKAACGAKKSGPLQSEPLLDLGVPEYTEIIPPSADLQEIEDAVEQIVRVAFERKVLCFA